VLYRTNDTNGEAQADVATILVPDDPKPRLLSYQVAYDALTRRCAPSYEMLSGSMVEHLLMNKALRRGWIVVLPDYEGPEAQFLAGRNSGQGVLDGIRATRAFLPDTWVDAETPVALWGYSGGAFASLWAAEIAPGYAPEIPIVGVAAGGPPADLASTAEHIDGGLFAGLYFTAVIGLSRAYDAIDTDALLNDDGREMFADLAESCVGQELAWVKDPLLSGYTFDDMGDYTAVDNLLAVPAVKQVIAENRLGQRRIDAPLFYYQAFFDQLTPREDARKLARRYCEQGTPVDFRQAIGEHISAAITQASSAVNYLDARFDGKPPSNACTELLEQE
jgi:pimeloyl-ACP methyl ester carboxylesterase